MAITHSTAARNALADQIDTLLNSGTTDSAGDLVIQDGTTDLVVITMQDPSFGSASTGTITLQGTPLSGTAAATGTADSFELRDKDNTAVVSGSVTGSGGGGDIELDNTAINSGQTVEITSLTYSASS